MDAKTFVDHQMHRDDKMTGNMYLSRNYCIFQFTFIVIHRSSSELNVMLFGSLTFCLLCLVSNMKCLCPCDWKKARNMFICIFRVAYMKVNKLNHLQQSIVSLKQNFKHQWSKRHFPPQIFVSWQKLNEKASFVQTKCCLRGLKLSIEFSLSKTFDETSWEQIMEFTELCTILYLWSLWFW